MSPSLTVLLVEPDNNTRALLTSALQGAGVNAVAVDDFHSAKHVLQSHPPDVLITEIRLGAYNGLHLLLRAKSAHRALIAFVTARNADPVLKREAEQLGATFVVKEGDQQWIAALVAMFRTSLPTGPAGAV
jgi:DNA-binding response OmpR family regulator